MPRVYNRHHGDAPPEAKYIGRGTPYGNMFIPRSHYHKEEPGTIIVESRDEACDRFDARVENDPEFKQFIKDTLKGKDLLCSCYPLRCHGDTLIRVANEE